MKTAIRDNNPVVIFERQADVQRQRRRCGEDYSFPFGEAAILREGNDITIGLHLVDGAGAHMQRIYLCSTAVRIAKDFRRKIIDPPTIVPARRGHYSQIRSA